MGNLSILFKSPEWTNILYILKRWLLQGHKAHGPDGHAYFTNWTFIKYGVHTWSGLRSSSLIGNSRLSLVTNSVPSTVLSGVPQGCPLLGLSLLCFQFYLLFLPEIPIIFTHYSYAITYYSC